MSCSGTGFLSIIASGTWRKLPGETEGRHVLFIAPTVGKAPEKGRIALEIPETEARRAKLDDVIPLWVMVDEMIAFVLEASHVLEDRVPRGQFARAFTDMVVARVHEVRRAGKLCMSGRT